MASLVYEREIGFSDILEDIMVIGGESAIFRENSVRNSANFALLTCQAFGRIGRFEKFPIDRTNVVKPKLNQLLAN